MQSSYRSFAFGFFVVLFFVPGFAAEPPSLEGKWDAVGSTHHGKPRDKINFEGMQWTLTKETLEVSPGKTTPAGLAGKGVLKCTYAVDNTKTPAHFNWSIGDGDKKATVEAIYELKDDVLRVCFGPRGTGRPEGFDTKDNDCSVYEFKRAKE